MSNEYIIINKTTLQKRIEELTKEKERFNKFIDTIEYNVLNSLIKQLEQILSQSTPLIPEIEKAIDFGKDCIREHSYIAEDWNNTPIIEYHDSTEEINRYISNLKLDI
jgi:predicted transcriptional regulator